jgi:mRNA interferase RelE/StbE
MSYHVVITATAAKERKRLESKVLQRLDSMLRNLSETPWPRRAKKLSGSKKDWRLRVGDYRILYEVDTELEKVTVWRIAHRREVYR